MRIIDGDEKVTAQLYDEQYEEYTEKTMSVIDWINTYTDEGVTPADDVLDNIREEIERQEKWLMVAGYNQYNVDIALNAIKLEVDKYKAESDVEE